MLKHTTFFAEDRRSENGELVRFDNLEVGAYFMYKESLFRKIETLENEILALHISDLEYYTLTDDEIVEFVPVVKASIQTAIHGRRWQK